MEKKQDVNVTMRVRIGERELEISGPQDFVKKEIEAFKEEQKSFSPAPSVPNVMQSVIQATSGGKKMSVSQFFRKMNPKTDVDRVLAAGYYLEKFDNYDSFIASEIRDIVRSAKINPPKNTNDSINNNIKKGLIMAAGDKDGKRAFVLTSDGEDTINEMLKD